MLAVEEKDETAQQLIVESIIDLSQAVRHSQEQRLSELGLLAAGIPAGPILSYPEAFEGEHGTHRGMCMEIDHPIEGKVKNIGFPVKMLGTPQQVRRHPPLLGEHNEEIIAEINALKEPA